MTPRFSIVIPTYNNAGSVADTVRSCLEQTCTDLEVIVVDDGSTDNTQSVLASLKEPRLVITRQPNAGPAAARNRGMDTARGQFIAFLDADDYWFPEYLETASQALNEDANRVLYSQIIVDRGVGRYWVKPKRALDAEESIYDFLYIHGGFIQTSTMIIPAALGEKVRWDESVTFGDNDQFAIDCWRTGITFHMLPKPCTLYADIISDNALSQLPIYAGSSPKYTNFFTWMSTQKEHMSPQAWAGFRGSFESVGLARKAPLKSFSLLWQGYRVGAISATGLIRQSVQNYFPRAYRRLVDQYVRLRGLSLEQARNSDSPA